MTAPDDYDPDVAALLDELSAGSEGALNELVPLVYRDLRSLARRHLSGERSDRTMNTTALVHETYIRLVDLRCMTWEDLPHFMAMASRMMRRVLIDFARKRRADKRGGGTAHVTLTNIGGPVSVDLDDLLALDEALVELETKSERGCRVVECRFFAGLTIAETADALGVSPGTVKRDWRLARAWLNDRLADSAEPGP